MATAANVALGITATNSTNAAFRAARNNVVSMRTGLNGMAGSVQQNRRLIQQFGMQVSDFSVQVAGGQSAILALTQQVPQFVQGFGAVGGILAALITVFGTLALIITKTGTSLNDLTPIAGVLREEVEWLAMAFDYVKWAVIEAANLIVNNLDRIAIATALLVGWWLGGLVTAAIAAAGVIGTLTAAFRLLTVVMMRIPLIALVVVVVEAIYQFMRLVDAVGSVGAAFGLLKDVALESFDRIGMMGRALGQNLISMAYAFQSAFLMALNRIIGGFMEMTYQIAEGLNTLFNTNMFRGAPLGLVTQELARQTLAAEGAAVAHAKNGQALMDSARAPLQSVKAIRDLLSSMGDDEQIDVRDWFGGVEEGAAGAGGAAEKAAKQVETFGQAAAGVVTSGLDRLFDAMFEGGKKAIDVLRDIGKELLKMVAKQQAFSLLAKLMPGTFGSGGFLDLGKMIKPYAKGGVVNTPTMFPMSGGKTGLTGEAGPEAILPLTRGANGALGVQAGGAGGGGMQVNVITPPGAKVEQSQRTGPGGMTIRDIVIKEMNQATASGQVDRVNRQRYGLEPVPAKR